MTVRRPRVSRRGVLALAGSAALAGCSGLGGSGGDGESPTIQGDALLSAVEGDWPALPETMPVEIEQSYLDEGVARARRLLAVAPAPLGPDEIPNGAIRREVRRSRTEATDALDAVADAESPRAAMSRVADARRHARAVAAAWRAIDAGLDRADLRDAAATIRDDLDAFRDEWRYVGDEPVRAVLVHGEIEQWVRGVDARLDRVRDPERRQRDDPVALGETAARVERARAALDDARHVHDRYVDAVGEPRRLRPTFEAAGRTLARRVDERRSGLPSGDPAEPSSFVDGEVDRTPAAAALTDIAYGAGIGRERDGPSAERPATRVLRAHDALANLRAFEAVLDRIRAGGYVTVSDAEDVRSLRDAAREATTEAAGSEEWPELDRTVLADLAGLVRYADRELRGYDADDAVSVEHVTRELGWYVEVAAVARATPPTSDAVAGIVRSS